MTKKTAAVIDTVPIPGKPETEKAPSGALSEQRAAFRALLAEQKKAASLAKGELPPEPKEATPAAAEAPPEPQPEAPQEAKPSKDLVRLRDKLSLAGFARAALEKLSEDELRESWEGVEERERDRALAHQRASEAEKKFQETTSKKAEPERVPTAELDLQELSADLADQFGEDEAGALLKALTKLVEPLRKENAEIRAVLEAAREHGVKGISKSNRDRLLEKNPALKNDAAWSILETHVLETFKKEPKKYSSAEAAFDDVHEALYGELLQKSAAPAVPTVSEAEGKARAKAAALTSPGSQKSQKKVTPLEADFAAWKHLKANPEDLEGAQRARAHALQPQ